MQCSKQSWKYLFKEFLIRVPDSQSTLVLLSKTLLNLITFSEYRRGLEDADGNTAVG